MDEFVESVIQSVRATNICEPSDRVLLALSGGPDSVFLCYVLSQFLNENGLTAVYFDHGVRSSSEIQKDIDVVTHITDLLTVPLIIEKLKGLELSKDSFEMKARKYRYTRLVEIAREKGISLIATGHHNDDQVETVLMQLFRGAKSGLGGMRDRRSLGKGVTLIRPLLNLKKSDIEVWLKDKEWAYAIDSSNRDTRFVRNKIRHDIIPVLKKDFPQFQDKLLSFVDYFRESQAYLSHLINPVIAESIETEGAVLLKRALIKKLDPFLQKRVIYSLCRQLDPSYETSEKHIVEVFQKLNSKGFHELHLPQGWRAYLTQLNLIISRHKIVPQNFHIRLTPDQVNLIPEIGKRVSVEYLEDVPSKFEKDPNVACFDADLLLVENVRVSSLRAGDKITPLGTTYHKKVSDLLSEHKIDAVFRWRVPMFWVDDTLFWIGGVQQSQHYCVTEKTQKVIRLRIL